MKTTVARSIDGISETSLHKYKAKFSGMVVSDSKRQMVLEGENVKFKKLLAEAMRDSAILEDNTPEK